MVDFEKIGRRIAEERKYILKLSQEKMAEDLGMYQADISNIEKAKKGSGITDLSRLDLIADYFNIPLETLLFGREDKRMLKYEGDKMQLKPSKKKLTKTQKETMDRLTGTDVDLIPPIEYECGPYLILTFIEDQVIPGRNTRIEDGHPVNPDFVLHKPHTYVFFGGELIAVMTADLTTVMQHVYHPSFLQLQKLIQFDVLDVTDVLRTLNPYWALWQFTGEGPEREEYYHQMYRRMDEIRGTGEDRFIIYVESIFIREDCRRNGICRMYIDLIRRLAGGDPIIWLNLEPTAGAELEREYDFYPTYTIADIGQLNMNASIAEHLGFKVDPDTWHRKSEVLGADGSIRVETLLVRKCAYFIPPDVRKILQNDGDLVALGRAKQKLVQSRSDDRPSHIDLRDGIRDGLRIMEWKESGNTEELYFYAAVSESDPEDRRFGCMTVSPLEHGVDYPDQIEMLKSPGDADSSPNHDMYRMLMEMLNPR